MNFLVKQVSYQSVLPLRAKVLRAGKTAEECLLPKDKMNTTYHFAAFEQSRIIGVATVQQENHPYLKANAPYRLRGMAADVDFRKRGVGRAIMVQVESFLKNHNVDLLWFNARINAFPFYQSMGFEFDGELFELPDIGPHKVMYKYLVPR